MKPWMIAFVLCAAATAAGDPQPPLPVVVTIPPLAGLAERIGGDRLEIQVLADAGQDPHTFEPTPRQLAQIESARLLIGVGLPFEVRLVQKLHGVERGLMITDASAGILKRAMHTGHGHDHPDPHVWLSPVKLEAVVENIAASLKQVDPEGEARYAEGADSLKADLIRLHRELTEQLAPLKGKSLFVFHPAFGYFAEAYGMEQVAVEIEGKSPTPRQLAALIERAREQQVRAIFLQPQFDPRAAASVARAIRGAVVPLDPLARDVIANLRAMGRAVHDALSDEG